jgi:hypothetical protein
METNMNNFADAFEPLKPLIIADFEAYVTRQVKRYAETWDTMSDAAKQSIRRGNDRTWIFARRFAVMDSNRIGAKPTGDVKVEWLSKVAAENAEAQIAEFARKLQAKLGQIGDFKAVFSRGADFTITGNRSGREIRVEQQTIFKVSALGNPFNQFPARIYVDGKFTPAAEYEAAVA